MVGLTTVSDDWEQSAEVVAVPSLCVTGTPVILGQFAAAGSGKFQAGMWIEH
jgi:hypothetical protein